MSKIVEVIKDNWNNNYKMILAIATEMLITIMIILSYGFRAEQDVRDILFTMWISIQPSLFIAMRLIGRGDITDMKDQLAKMQTDNDNLIVKDGYNQVIAGYAIQVAAIKGQVPESIIANEKWIDANIDAAITPLEEVKPEGS